MTPATADAAPCAAPWVLATDATSTSPAPTLPVEFVDNAAAAAWLGVSSERLRKSRSTGELAGLPAPRYWRLGTKGRVRYRVADLRQWVEAHAVPSAPGEPAAAAGQ